MAYSFNPYCHLVPSVCMCAEIYLRASFVRDLANYWMRQVKIKTKKYIVLIS